jgi:hypothetical protein
MTDLALTLTTAFCLDDRHRIIGTREPGGSHGPLFYLVRGPSSCAWAVREDVPGVTAVELDHMARTEPPSADVRSAPKHAAEYVALLRDLIGPTCDVSAKVTESDGPAYVFPDSLEQPTGTVTVDREEPLMHHFRGWIPGEIAAGRAPVFAVVEDGHPVSICFCARLSERAAAAGVETASAFRGRGYAPRVVAAWALAMRASLRVPLYNTAWSNRASLGVARKLGLQTYASTWSLTD